MTNGQQIYDSRGFIPRQVSATSSKSTPATPISDPQNPIPPVAKISLINQSIAGNIARIPQTGSATTKGFTFRRTSQDGEILTPTPPIDVKSSIEQLLSSGSRSGIDIRPVDIHPQSQDGSPAYGRSYEQDSFPDMGMMYSSLPADYSPNMNSRTHIHRGGRGGNRGGRGG